MVKIHVISDVHVEFGRLNKTLPTGDVLVMAGDIVPVRYLNPHMTDARSRAIRKAAEALFTEARANFKHVLYLTGNHEHYNDNISFSSSIIREALPGITLLDNTAVHLDDNTVLVGGTLWTDMNKGRDAKAVAYGMNDFRFIDIWDRDQDQPRRFTTDDAIAMHKRTRAFIGKTARANQSKTVIVATHHAPSIQGVDVHRYGRSDINAGYYTDMETFIGRYPNIRAWIHGHTHIQKEYRIHQCKVISNARGYIGHERSAETFDPDRWIDTSELGLGELSSDQSAQPASTAQVETTP